MDKKRSDRYKEAAGKYRAAYEKLLDLASKLKSFDETKTAEKLGNLGIPDFEDPFEDELEVFHEELTKMQEEVEQYLSGIHDGSEFPSDWGGVGIIETFTVNNLITNLIDGIIPFGSMFVDGIRKGNISGSVQNEERVEDVVRRFEDMQKELARPDITPEDKAALLEDMDKKSKLYELAIIRAAADLVQSSIKQKNAGQ